jgi:hypothetical protein
MSSANIAWGAFSFVKTAANFDVISTLRHDPWPVLMECSNALSRLRLPNATLAGARRLQFLLAFRDHQTKIAPEDRRSLQY